MAQNHIFDAHVALQSETLVSVSSHVLSCPALSSALLRAAQWLQWNVMTMDWTKPCIHDPPSHSRSLRLGALITESGVAWVHAPFAFPVRQTLPTIWLPAFTSNCCACCRWCPLQLTPKKKCWGRKRSVNWICLCLRVVRSNWKRNKYLCLYSCTVPLSGFITCEVAFSNH